MKKSVLVYAWLWALSSVTSLVKCVFQYLSTEGVNISDTLEKKSYS